MRRSGWMWVGAVGGFLAVALVLASLFGGGGPTPDNLRGTDDANALTRGIAQRDMTIGDPAAPVEIVEYLDVACPACAKASRSTTKDLIAGPVRDGDVRLTMRPLALLHPQTSERGNLAIRAAGMQGAAWQFAAVVLHNQGRSGDDWLTDEILEAVATKTGLDVERWRADYAGDEVIGGMRADTDASAADQIQVTPTFIVRGPRGERTLEGVPSEDTMSDAIAAVS